MSESSYYNDKEDEIIAKLEAIRLLLVTIASNTTPTP